MYEPKPKESLMTIQELNNLLENHKVVFCLSKEERQNRSKVASNPLKKNRRLIARNSRRNNR